MNENALVARLHALLGRRCRHRGEAFRLLDLLPAEGILVLEREDAAPAILADQYERASHRANGILQVPVFGESRDLPSAEVEDLLADIDARAET